MRTASTALGLAVAAAAAAVAAFAYQALSSPDTSNVHLPPAFHHADNYPNLDPDTTEAVDQPIITNGGEFWALTSVACQAITDINITTDTDDAGLKTINITASKISLDGPCAARAYNVFVTIPLTNEDITNPDGSRAILTTSGSRTLTLIDCRASGEATPCKLATQRAD